MLDRDDGTNELKLRTMIPSERLKLVHAQNPRGDVGHLLNIGLEAAETELIARMDDDDTYAEDRILTQVIEFSQDESTVLVTSACDVVDQEQRTLYQVIPPESDLELKLSLLNSNIIVHSAVMYKKSAVLRVGGYRTEMMGCEDYDLWFRLVPAGSFRGISTSHVKYLSHRSGASKRRVSVRSVWKLYRVRLQAAAFLGIPSLTHFGGYVRWIFHFRPGWARISVWLWGTSSGLVRRLLGLCQGVLRLIGIR